MLASKTTVSCACSSSRGVAVVSVARSTRVRSLAAPLRASAPSARVQRVQLAARSTTILKAVAEDPTAAAESTSGDNWVPVCRPEELPKGVRKEMDVGGRSIMIFWYRNEIFAIQSRSPAEGAYSQGFMEAKFTQDYGIECPSTKSLFSLKDGSILDWCPNNPVMKMLTPANLVAPMEIYPIKLTQEAILVDVSASGRAVMARDKGGADTSLENNNVFSVMPTVYFEGMDPALEAATMYQQPVSATKVEPAVAAITIGALAAVGVSGTLICLYLENLALLAAFWLGLGSFVAFNGFKLLNPENPK